MPRAKNHPLPSFPPSAKVVKRKARLATEVRGSGGAWGKEVRERLSAIRGKRTARQFATWLSMPKGWSVVTKWAVDGLPGAGALRKLQARDVSADYLLGAKVPKRLSARTPEGDLARQFVEYVVRTYLAEPEPSLDELIHSLDGDLVTTSQIDRSRAAAEYWVVVDVGNAAPGCSVVVRDPVYCLTDAVRGYCERVDPLRKQVRAMPDGAYRLSADERGRYVWRAKP